jgi:transposase
MLQSSKIRFSISKLNFHIQNFHIRSNVLMLWNEGYSFSKIADTLGVSKTTAHRIVKRFQETNILHNRHRSGRPPISTPREDRMRSSRGVNCNLIRLVKENRRASSTTLSHDWQLSSGKTASPSTVRRKLLAHGYDYKPAVRKPRLAKRHVLARKLFCNMHKSWSKLLWRRVKFSDEMNLEVDCRKSRIMFRRRPSEKYAPDCIVQRTKQGSGSIGIWACMDYNGICGFEIFDGRLNQQRYIGILNEHLLPTVTREQQMIEMIKNKKYLICFMFRF